MNEGNITETERHQRKQFFFQTLKINSWCGVHHVLCNILVFIQAAGTIIKAFVAKRWSSPSPSSAQLLHPRQRPKVEHWTIERDLIAHARLNDREALLFSRLYLEKVIRSCPVSWDENVAVWLETIRLTGNPWELVGLEWHWSYRWGEFLWSPWYLHIIFCA